MNKMTLKCTVALALNKHLQCTLGYTYNFFLVPITCCIYTWWERCS